MTIIGLIVSLLLINILSHYGWKLYLSILAGIVVISLFNRFTAAGALSLFYLSAIEPATVYLGFITMAMTAFGSILKTTGGLKKMVEKLSLIVGDKRHQIVLMPAVISLLAFPGGAVFSAPLVEETGSVIGLDRMRTATANLVFRHLFYFIYPFYSGMIMLSELSGINIYAFIRMNFLLLAALLLLTFLLLFRRLDYKKDGRFDRKELPALLWSISPILLTVTTGVVFKLYFPLAILSGIALALCQYPPRELTFPQLIKNRLHCLWRGINWPMTLAIVLILIMRRFLEASGAITGLAGMIMALGIPFLATVVIVPYLIGFITGNQTASVAMSVPLILTVLPSPELKLPSLILLFTSSLGGYLGSPLHLCAVATAEHFKIPVQKLLKTVNLYSALIIATGILFFLGSGLMY